MTERDGFELDLADALRAYADEATTQVHPTELARNFAIAYPQGRTKFGPWRLGSTVRLGATVRFAWVLLLLAGLLIAMVGGMLIVGSQPVPAFACPAGSNPDEPGPVDQARPFGWFEAAFDRRAGKLVALVNAGDPDGVLPIETWTFDVCANTWTQMHPDQQPPAQISNLVYCGDSDLTIGVHYEDWHPDPDPSIETVWAYDLQADTWTEKGEAPTSEPGFHDPVSGLIVAGGVASELWNYDVEADTWTPMHQTTPPREYPGYSEYAYDASVDRIMEYAGGIGYGEGGDVRSETWLFDIRTGAWSKSGAETPVIKMANWAVPAIVYDEAAERTIVAGDFQWGAYDATADHWEILSDAEPGETLGPPPMLYDPVNERLILRGGEPEPGISGDLLAFDLATREWTVLLEPTDG